MQPRIGQRKEPSSSLVPLTVRGVDGVAVVNTSSTFTLMSEGLWQQITLAEEPLQSTERQKFVMADGTVRQSLGRKRQDYWQGGQWDVEVHIMEDCHLAFPLILGLDFLSQTAAVLDLARNMTLDTEKALDQVKWSYLFDVLRKFNLGDTFIAWIKLLYKYPRAKILNNGMLTSQFRLFRSTRQGPSFPSCSHWPFSPSQNQFALIQISMASIL